jgi:hypothetical protein
MRFTNIKGYLVFLKIFSDLSSSAINSSMVVWYCARKEI